MSFEKARSITLLITFLKDRLKQVGKGKLADQSLADTINAFQPPQSPLKLDGGKVSAILRGWHLKPDEQDALLIALQSLIRDRKLNIDVHNVPQAVEQEFGPELPELFSNYAPSTFVGDMLGDLSSSLSGPWHLFYVSPVNRNGKFQTEIRGTAALVHTSHPSAKSMDVELISSRGHWKGPACINETHMYLTLSDVDKTETAFFVMNKPTRRRPFIVGVGSALTRFEGPAMLPVAGFVCFGEKWMGPREASNKELIGVLQQAVEGHPLSETDAKKIRDEFCVTYDDVEQLRNIHPKLFAHIQTISINGQKGLAAMPWLYVTWP